MNPLRLSRTDRSGVRRAAEASRGDWQGTFETLQDPDPEWLLPDPTVIRARRHAAGAGNILHPGPPEDQAPGRPRGGSGPRVHCVR